MKFKDANKKCDVWSALYRTRSPTKLFTEADLMDLHPVVQLLSKYDIGNKVPKRYWKLLTPTLDRMDESVPDKDKLFDDWEVYSPNDFDV